MFELQALIDEPLCYLRLVSVIGLDVFHISVSDSLLADTGDLDLNHLMGIICRVVLDDAKDDQSVHTFFPLVVIFLRVGDIYLASLPKIADLVHELSHRINLMLRSAVGIDVTAHHSDDIVGFVPSRFFDNLTNLMKGCGRAEEAT